MQFAPIAPYGVAARHRSPAGSGTLGRVAAAAGAHELAVATEARAARRRAANS